MGGLLPWCCRSRTVIPWQVGICSITLFHNQTCLQEGISIAFVDFFTSDIASLCQLPLSVSLGSDEAVKHGKVAITRAVAAEPTSSFDSMLPFTSHAWQCAQKPTDLRGEFSTGWAAAHARLGPGDRGGS